MPRIFRRHLRLLLTLTAAWALLLGAAHALHAAQHDAGPAGSLTPEHACVLCSLDRHTPLPEPVGGASIAPAPVFEGFAALTPSQATPLSLPRRAPAASAGRAPPSASVS